MIAALVVGLVGGTLAAGSVVPGSAGALPVPGHGIGTVAGDKPLAVRCDALPDVARGVPQIGPGGALVEPRCGGPGGPGGPPG